MQWRIIRHIYIENSYYFRIPYHPKQWRIFWGGAPPRKKGEKKRREKKKNRKKKTGGGRREGAII